ncbi:FecR domain-containing protein [Inquilinus sp. Marseille-Q2685]|uniref:FecR family protein n=1 Tax=Inquilinus sp. Marseille-Q2685 TaxID=2866581 RepID=UPI001CE42157|nr:FecR domain-containing protein [Inquilinus sp. Marseille-Q2685]
MDTDDNAQDIRIARDARDWVVRLASGTATEADLAAFRAWRAASPDHDRAFARERAFWRQLQAMAPEAPPRTAPRPRGIGRRALLGGGAALAAGVAGVALAPRLALLWRADHRTGIGEQARIPLPDGSAVLLNTDSAIALGFRPGLRLVTLLQGEALFEARRDAAAPFRVAALGGNSETEGAVFAVRAVEDEATVTVAEGRAGVFGPAAAAAPMPPAGAVALAAGQQARYREGSAPGRAAPVDLGAALAWRAGRIVFDRKPFAEAVAELGRYVPERVVLADGGRAAEPVGGVFSIREAQAALAALAETQGLALRRVPGVVIVIG